MSPGALFSHFGSRDMAEIIGAAKRSVCYAGPGIQAKPAQAMAEAATRLGAEMLTVCLDFDERAMHIGRVVSAGYATFDDLDVEWACLLGDVSG